MLIWKKANLQQSQIYSGCCTGKSSDWNELDIGWAKQEEGHKRSSANATSFVSARKQLELLGTIISNGKKLFRHTLQTDIFLAET